MGPGCEGGTAEGGARGGEVGAVARLGGARSGLSLSLAALAAPDPAPPGARAEVQLLS